MTPTGAEQLFRLASDHTGIYEDAREWFRSQGPASAETLIAGLDDARLGSIAHWRILLLLREFALPSTLPAILKVFHAALASSNHIVLPGALEALAQIPAHESVAALISVLDSPDDNYVNHAAVLLAKLGGPIEPLAALLERPESARRKSGVRALRIVNTAEARAILDRHRVAEKDPEVLKLMEPPR